MRRHTSMYPLWRPIRFEPDEDIKIVFSGMRPGEKLYEELLMAEEGLETTKNNKIYVAQPIFTDLGLLRREID